MKVNVGTGNWSTVGTWGQVTNVPTLHASAVVSIGVGNTFTATFTAPNTTNACKGVCVYMSTPGSSTITCTLQESTVDTAATRAITFAEGTGSTKQGWVYFEFATPYVFTTTGAGAYRFKFVGSVIVTTSQMAADSGGTLPAYQAVDNRTGVPGAEAALVIGANYTTTRTVTMDGTQTVGAGTDTAQLGAGSSRSIGYGVQVGTYGVLKFDTAANAQLTSLGHVMVSGSTAELQMGTVASPYPTGQTATLKFNENGVSVNYGLYVNNTGLLTLQGQPKSSTTLYKTTYVSGTGVAASPLVTGTAVDWSVGDEIIITGSVHDQSETRFIITKNSSTSYVLSATSGGAEAAFANSHTTDHKIYNIFRNVIIDTTNVAQAFYLVNNSNSSGSVNVDWVRFNNVGSATVNKQGIYPSINGGGGLTTTVGNFDYCVIGNSLGSGWVWTNSQASETFTGLGVVNSTSASITTTNGGFTMLTSSDNKTIVDAYCINLQGLGIQVAVSKNGIWTRPELWCCNRSNTATIGSIMFNAPVAHTFNNLNVQSGRQQGFMFGGATKCTFNNIMCGNIGTNTTDINFVSSSLNLDCHFEAPVFGSGTLISNYTTQALGSKLTMQGINASVNDHRTYETNGTTRSTGTGLADTEVRTSGSLAWRIAPENNTTGLVKEYKVLARAGQAVQILGFLKKNATFGASTLTVELFLPGSLVADATQTMANDTNYNPYSLVATWSGTTDRLATVRITAISSTAGAYVYLDDINNGSTTNKFISLDMFDKGEISPIMFEQLGDAASVWAIATSTLVAPGTTGLLLTRLLTKAIFLALK